MKFVVEFAGGLEALVKDGQKRVVLELTETKAETPLNCQGLIQYISTTLINNERKEMFVVEGKCGSVYD